MGYLKIAGAALNQTPIDWENNKNNIIKAIELAQAEKVDILCLPELCITGYGCEDLFLSDWVSKQASEVLQEILPFTKDIVVSVGLPVKIGGNVYNTACLMSNGYILGITAKQFLANDGVHYESRWFTPWQAGTQVEFSLGGKIFGFGDLIYDIHNIKIAYEICEDAWKEDNIRPACRHILKKVNLILNPSASHFAFGKSDFRYNLIKTSSEKFNCIYLYTNLLGNEAGRMIYDGEVLIAGKGKLLQRNHRFSFNHVDMVSCEVNFETGEVKEKALGTDYREKEYEFKEAITLALFDYMRKSRSRGFVLSLSGGADSSACAIAVAEMIRKGCNELGTDNFLEKAGLHDLNTAELQNLNINDQILNITSKIFTCAYQSTRNSGGKTLEAAQELALSLGATFHQWSVDEEVESYKGKIENALERKLDWQKDDIALQNIQARARSPVIWMLANINKALLITTSNRSEGDVGYTTMDGDTSGSIAPLAGVDKHFIRQWLIWAESNLGFTGLQYVNSLAPTAELRPLEQTQTDEADLMPYDVLREIEIQAIPERKPPVEVFKYLWEKGIVEDKEKLAFYIGKFFRMWSVNQWKRERFAPSFHMDAFNIDPRSWYRFPILSGGYSKEISEMMDYVNANKA